MSDTERYPPFYVCNKCGWFGKDRAEHPPYEFGAMDQTSIPRQCPYEPLDTNAEIRAVAADRERWSLTLQSLTPSGSEYADDPERCLTFVRGAREWQHQKILSLVKDLKHLRDQAGPDSCADQVVRRVDAERLAEEAQQERFRLAAELAETTTRKEEAERACEQADRDFRAMHDQLEQHNREQAQILRLTALAAQHVGGSATLPLTVSNLHAQLATANADLDHERERIAEYTRAMEEKDGIIADIALKRAAANTEIERLKGVINGKDGQR